MFSTNVTQSKSSQVYDQPFGPRRIEGPGKVGGTQEGLPDTSYPVTQSSVSTPFRQAQATFSSSTSQS